MWIQNGPKGMKALSFVLNDAFREFFLHTATKHYSFIYMGFEDGQNIGILVLRLWSDGVSAVPVYGNIMRR